jgi:predicted permease
MKKLLLILLCLFSLNIITYASFPITENSPSDILNAISFQMADEEEGEDGVKWWLLIPFVVALGFGAYFLIRAWWRSWRDDIRWVKILTYILLAPLLLLLLLAIIHYTVDGGIVYNMA